VSIEELEITVLSSLFLTLIACSISSGEVFLFLIVRCDCANQTVLPTLRFSKQDINTANILATPPDASNKQQYQGTAQEKQELFEIYEEIQQTKAIARLENQEVQELFNYLQFEFNDKNAEYLTNVAKNSEFVERNNSLVGLVAISEDAVKETLQCLAVNPTVIDMQQQFDKSVRKVMRCEAHMQKELYADVMATITIHRNALTASPTETAYDAFCEEFAANFAIAVSAIVIFLKLYCPTSIYLRYYYIIHFVVTGNACCSHCRATNFDVLVNIEFANATLALIQI